MPGATATLLLPYPVPADDNDVPLYIQQLADRLEAVGGGIKAMTTAQRDALVAGDRWTGRIIWNTTKGIKERYTGAAWVPDLRATAAGVVGRSELTAEGNAYGGLILARDSGAAGVAAQELGRAWFIGQDSAGADKTYAYLRARIVSAVAGAEKGQLQFWAKVLGVDTELFGIDGGYGGPYLNAPLFNGVGDRSFRWGAGSPEGVVTASGGAFYLDTTNGIAYLKRSGAGNTGWSPRGAFIGASVLKTATQTVNTGVAAQLSFDTEGGGYDTSAFHDNVTNNTRITIPAGLGGWYRITYDARWTNGATVTGQIQLYLKKGGVNLPLSNVIVRPEELSASQLQSRAVSTVSNLSAGEYIEVTFDNASGSNAVVSLSTVLQVEYLGA